MIRLDFLCVFFVITGTLLLAAGQASPQSVSDDYSEENKIKSAIEAAVLNERRYASISITGILAALEIEYFDYVVDVLDFLAVGHGFGQAQQCRILEREKRAEPRH